VPPLPPAVTYGDVLVRIRGQLSLPQVDHPRVDREIEWLQRNPDYITRVFGRAQRYLHHVANEVEARGLPGDLALLPVVESAFNPFAYSRSHASGLWQFIAPTGERYGLKRNYWQDQRRDVIESTRAALDYSRSCATASTATGSSRSPPTTTAPAISSAQSTATSHCTGRPTSSRCRCRPKRAPTCRS
jgi:hypothetical protein